MVEATLCDEVQRKKTKTITNSGIMELSIRLH